MSKRAIATPVRSRVVALGGHRSSGKTSLGELLLQAGGVTRSIGRVEQGSSLLDHLPEERERRQTIQLSFAWIPWGEQFIHLIDTPGTEALNHERNLAIAGADALIAVVDATAGVERGAEEVFELAIALALPRIAVLTKRERALDTSAVLDEIAIAGDARVVAVDVPVFEDDELVGLVSLLRRDLLLRAAADGDGAVLPEPLPEAVVDEVNAAWELLTEAVALTRDDLIERYLEDTSLPDDVVFEALGAAVSDGKLLPVATASAARGIGGPSLLELIALSLPRSPERVAYEPDGSQVHLAGDTSSGDAPFVAMLLASQRDADGQLMHVLRVVSGAAPLRAPWVHGERGTTSRVRKLYAIRGPRRKTADHVQAGNLIATWDALDGRPGDTFTDGPLMALLVPDLPPRMATRLLTPVHPTDDRKLADGLFRLIARDVGLEVLIDDVTCGVLLAGLTDVHLERALQRLRDEEGVRADATLPPVAYREVPAGSIAAVEGTHVVHGRDGDVREFGRCVLDLHAIDGLRVNRFADVYDDDEELPRRLRPLIEAGVLDAMNHGPTAGYPVIGAYLALVGGAYDILESTPEQFKLAGEKAALVALSRAGTRLLEPWWRVDVYVPSGDVGAVISEISSNRGRIIGLDAVGAQTCICVNYPYRELRTFSARLLGASAGRGRFYGEPSHYEPLPEALYHEVVACSPFQAALLSYEAVRHDEDARATLVNPPDALRAAVLD